MARIKLIFSVLTLASLSSALTNPLVKKHAARDHAAVLARDPAELDARSGEYYSHSIDTRSEGEYSGEYKRSEGEYSGEYKRSEGEYSGEYKRSEDDLEARDDWTGPLPERDLVDDGARPIFDRDSPYFDPELYAYLDDDEVFDRPPYDPSEDDEVIVPELDLDDDLAYSNHTLGNSTLERRGGPRKRCIGWKNEFSDSVLKYWKSDKVMGLYTWSTWSPNTHDIPFWPMFWGDKTKQPWQQFVKKNKSKHMGLHCNEPNLASQSNVSPAHAAQLFKQYQQPLMSKGWTFASPAPANGKTGLAWIKQYKQQHPDVWGKTEFAVAHFYSNSADAFIKYMKDYYAVVKKPIIVSETACQTFGHGSQCNMAQTKAYMRKVLHFVDTTPWMHSICYFGHFHRKNSGVNLNNAMMDSKGKPNELGKIFLYG